MLLTLSLDRAIALLVTGSRADVRSIPLLGTVLL